MTTILDPERLAFEFSVALAASAQDKTGRILPMLNAIFPWLKRFKIKSDGPMQWVAIDVDSAEEKSQVVSRIEFARQLVERWMLDSINEMLEKK